LPHGLEALVNETVEPRSYGDFWNGLSNPKPRTAGQRLIEQ
jgi:hypothetical protein